MAQRATRNALMVKRPGGRLLVPGCLFQRGQLITLPWTCPHEAHGDLQWTGPNFHL